MAATIVALSIFFALSLLHTWKISLLHTWKMYRKRMWFCLSFVIGVYLVGGLGPKAESCLYIKVRWLTTIFVVGDVFAFMVQASGAGFSAAGSNPKMGENIVVAGLAIQILFFVVFVAAAMSFQLQYRHHSSKPQTFSSSSASWKSFFTSERDKTNGEVPWRSMMNMLYAVSALILARCIFRIIEYLMGADAYLLSHEWTLYLFDRVLMAAAMANFYVFYPSSSRRTNILKQADTLEVAQIGQSNGNKP
ncbi:RTA1 like protein-domain-containing protein [Dactylonectria estremocensis]|uniref:RTA1 like protein-domain-containing protein n=1 Tax=Dactylonectria estremocensis TaxID=1079267 RepID=A0A9P9DN61_9HYPO|nr:RTA1 like protein-domain-containing protein [Dactylonectria estremocensis]